MPKVWICTILLWSTSQCALLSQELNPEPVLELLSEGEANVDETLLQIQSPIDINSEDIHLLTGLGLINPIQENALSLYKSVNGALISLYELQAIPFFDLQTIRAILPYVNLAADKISAQKITTSIASGKNEVTLRWRSTIQRPVGYQSGGAYNGDRNGVFVRFLHTGQRVSFGFLAEKDPGERWVDSEHNQFLDFQSFHLLLFKPLKWLDQIIIGDFSASFGMGLVKNSSFTTGKSALATNILSAGTALRALRSAREYDYFRGIALAIHPAPKIKLNLIASKRKSDASVSTATSIQSGDTILTQRIASLSSSGLHRTSFEANRKSAVGLSTLGLVAEFNLGKFKLQANAIYQANNLPLPPSNGTGPNGSSTLNNSISVRYQLQNAILFGEVAFDENGRANVVGGAMVALNKSIDFALQFRKLDPDYVHNGARTFAENSKAENETGLYTGIEIRPFKQLKMNAFADFWKHPAPRFGIDYPSTGNEQLVKVTFSQRKQFEYYVQWRSEKKLYNFKNERRLSQLQVRSRQYFRIHLSHQLNRDFELRNRIELSRYQLGDEEPQKGILIIQDFLFRPLGKQLNITGRLAYFDIDSYNARIYAYENDLTYQFSIPAYAGNGTRFYLNLKYKGIRNTTVEFRISHTQMFDGNTIGRGNDEIRGQGKTDLKVQMRFRF